MKSRSHMKRQKASIFMAKCVNISVLTIRNIAKLDFIAIINGNLGVLHIAYIIWNIVYLGKFL